MWTEEITLPITKGTAQCHALFQPWEGRQSCGPTCSQKISGRGGPWSKGVVPILTREETWVLIRVQVKNLSANQGTCLQKGGRPELNPCCQSQEPQAGVARCGVPLFRGQWTQVSGPRTEIAPSELSALDGLRQGGEVRWPFSFS